ncbi:hypothetical protein RZS08_13275, partial [Arthrospira platensis SPKY1]|nr:hypothetical protein [Arthrospira platensis SPKY1]
MSGGSVFNPQVDLAGNYTYTVTSPNGCGSASALVNIQIIEVANAGIDASVSVCSFDGPINLLSVLGGTPQAGGVWSPALVNGTFDPQNNTAGVYTYTVSNACGTASASVTVSVVQQADAGSNGIVTLCSNASAVSLFDFLGGTPQAGGVWSPALTGGIF